MYLTLIGLMFAAKLIVTCLHPILVFSTLFGDTRPMYLVGHTFNDSNIH